MTFPIWLQKLLKLLNIQFCNCDCDECFDCEHYWMAFRYPNRRTQRGG